MKGFQRQGIRILIGVLLVAGTQAQGQWCFELCLGKAVTNNSDLRIVQPSLGNDLTFTKVAYSNRSLDSPFYYVVRAGYFLPSCRYLGFEAEFIHAKVYSRRDQRIRVRGIWHGENLDRMMYLEEIVQEFSISHGLNFIFFNAVGRFGLIRNKKNQRDALAIMGRIGLGPLLLHSENTVEGKHREQYELDGPAMQISFGLDFLVWRKLRWIMEYKFTTAWLRDVNIADGKGKTTLNTHHFVFGFGVRL